MHNTKEKTLKLRIRFEFAIEVILICSIFILFGLAFLLTSNILSFNWASIIFTILGIVLAYLKASSYIEISHNQVTIQYMKFLQKKTIAINDIKHFVFYENNLLVEIYSKNNKVVQFYLKQRNREQLLNFIVTNYPDIPCLFYDKTDETAR